MSNDVLITPASRKIEFKDSSANVDAKIETDASGNLVITNPGGDISIGDTTADIFVGDGVNNIDIVFEQDGEIRGTTGVTITLGATDSNVRMATDLNLNSNDITNVGDLTVTGNLTVTGTTTTLETATLSVEDKNITLNYGSGDTSGSADGAGITIQDAIDSSTDASLLWDASNDHWQFSHDLQIPTKIRHTGDLDNYIGFSTDTQGFITGNSTRMQITNSLVRFNQEGLNQDFQVFGENIDNLLYVDASTDRVGIGTATPTERLHVEGNIELINNGSIGSLDGNYWQRIRFEDGSPSDTNAFNFETRNGGGDFVTHMTITNNGDVGIGTTSPSQPLTVTGADSIGIDDYVLHNGDTDTKFGFNAADSFKVRTGGGDRFVVNNNDSYFNNQVGIGKSAPDYKLHILESGVNAGAAYFEDGTSWLRVVPNLGSGGFNPMSVAGDIGFIFSTDADASTDSGTLGLLIAPHSDNASGIKICEDGDVGIGTTTPSNKLHVNSGTDDWPIRAQSSDAKAGIIIQDTNTTNYLITESYTLSIGNQASLSSDNLNIKSTGKVGLGTTAPSKRLHVVDSTAHQLQLQGNNSYWNIGTGWSGYYQDYFLLANSSGEKFVIDTNGNIGIGTNSPTTKLQVEGTAKFTKLRYTGGAESEGDEAITFRWNKPDNATNTTTWYKVCDVAIGTGLYKALSMTIKVTSANGNFGNSSDIEELYYVAEFNRSGGVQDDADFAVIYGTNGDNCQLRIYKTATGAFELQMKVPSNYRSNLLEATVNSANNGTVTVTDSDSTAGTTSGGTEYLVQTPSDSGEGNYRHVFPNINVTNNVGIGTTSPDKPLDVLGDIRSIDSSSNQHQLRATQVISYGTDAILNAQSTGDDVRLNTQGTTRLIATAEGNIGIGTSSPDSELQIMNNDGSSYRFGYGGSSDVYLDADNVYIRTDNGGANTAIISTSGVGIGTTSPSNKLHVTSGTVNTAIARFTGANNDRGLVISTAVSGITNDSIINYDAVSTNSVGQHAFKTDGTERVRIDASGRLGIGTTSPSQKLDVAGHININTPSGASQSGYALKLNKTNSSSQVQLGAELLASPWASNTNGGNLIFKTANSSGTATTAMTIDGAQRVGIGTTTPYSGTRTQICAEDTSPSLNTTAIDDTTLVLSNSDDDYGTVFGSLGTGVGLIQQRRVASAVYYGLALNPYGGNVGIGTTSPASKLSAVGTIRAEGMSTITGGGIGTEVRYDTSGDWGGILSYDRGNAAYKELRVEGSIIKFKESGTDVMTIDGNNVGIGTTTPNNKLTVSSSSDGINIIGTNSFVRWNSGDMMIRNEGSYAMGFHTYDGSSAMVEHMRITSAGNVGIGLSSPDSKLHIEQDAVEISTTNLDNGTAVGLHVTMPDAEITSGTVPGVAIGLGMNGRGRSYLVNTHVGTNKDASELSIYTESGGTISEQLIIKHDGKVGIGTTSPSAKLEVNGGIKASGSSYFNGSVSLNSGGQIGSGFIVSGDFEFEGADYSIVFDATANAFEWRDNAKAIFGTGDDMQLYHDGTNSIINNQTGTFYIDQNVNDGNLILRSDNGSGGLSEYIVCNGGNGSTQLKHYGSTKFETTSAGVSVSGTIIGNEALNVNASGTNDTRIEVGASTSSDHYAYIDLIGDATYTDYGLRIIRNNSGANTTSVIHHRGTGNFIIETQDSASLVLRTAGTAALTLGSSQNATFAGNLTVDDTLTIGDTTANSNSFILFGERVAASETNKPFIGQTNSGNNTSQDLGLGVHSSTGTVKIYAGNVTRFSEGAVRLKVANDHINFTEPLQMGGTEFLSDARNLSNIGTVSSGAITTEHTKSSTTNPIINIVNGSSSNEGYYAQFTREDAVVTGVIGRKSQTEANIYLATSDVGLKMESYITYKAVVPCNTDGTDVDNAIDLGNSSTRFDDVYATNGTIQTSDRNEKQDIQALSDAEQRVATACKGLIRRYKFNKAVTEKGDDARYHFGIIAQDLQAAFTAEGLDAGDYGMFISSTWTDDDGVEQTRLGVRYNELLAFIIATL